MLPQEPARAPRARDAAGRPVPAGSPEAVEPVVERERSPAQTLALARQLLATGRPFFAHDVLEARWKVAPAQERDLWQGLAQVCVGLTHLQRGNVVGGARLLLRGADRLVGYRGTAYGVEPAEVARQAIRRAESVEAGGEGQPGGVADAFVI